MIQSELSFPLPAWAMERNLILQAGAGSGKTYALVTLALHLLSGANARRTPVPPAKLVALTFTEKAGAERERLQKRLRPLAEGRPLEQEEPELAKTLALLGLPPPPADAWHRIRRDLALASVGTFHAFCAAQLRRFAPAAGLDPGFTVLDGDASRSLFDETVERHVFEALGAGDEGVRALVDEFGLFGERGGLITWARDILSRVEEEGLEPAVLDDGRFEDALAGTIFEGASERLRTAVDGLRSLAPKHQAKLAGQIAAYQDVVANLSAGAADRQLARLRAIKETYRKPSGDAGLPIEALTEAVDAWQEGLATIRVAPLGRAFVKLLGEVETRYRAAKQARESLDFADLQRILRDLLAADPASRRELKSRVGALLVDEFQDTSRLQLDLVALLAEQRGVEAAFDRVSPANQVLWEPGLLCVVGDRKQSIYEFRGADVAVFASLDASLSGPNAGPAPARRELLRFSRRTRPPLVSLANRLFGAGMTAASEPFEVAFTPDDALLPARPPTEGPVAELVALEGVNVEEVRRNEAAMIAARIDQLVHAPDEAVRAFDVDTSGSERPRRVEGRDVAILLRRMTNLEVYRSALAARGIAHVVVGGSGFYEAPEVVDAWALLRVIDEPSDALASAALLRSPWCGLSDASLVRLSAGERDGVPALRGVDLGRLLRERAPLPDAGEEARLDALLDFVRRHRPELDRLGPSALLSLALEELDYLAAIAALPDAEAIGANLTKLGAQLAGLSHQHATARGVVRDLTLRVRNARREAEAAASEESDPRCVRLMSIHQAKGLEFPVVFVADCGAQELNETDRISWDRDLGLALNFRLSDESLAPAAGLRPVRTRLAARAQAESLRLLYVAVTRARDFLVLSGGGARNGSSPSWLDLAQALPADLLPRKKFDFADFRAVPASPPSPVEPLPAGLAPAPRDRPLLPIRSVTSTVTRLQDFALCAERYRLRHDIGLDEHPPARFDVGDEDLDPALDLLQRGTLAHRLLELADFRDLPKHELDALLRAEGHDPTRDEIAAIRDDVRSFLGTPTARRLAALPAERRLREVPFFVTLDLGEGRRLGLKGQIDLVAITSEGADIVDYKHSRKVADADAHYAFQLRTYAVAVREFLGHGMPLRVSLAFLRERGLDPVLRPLSSAEVDGHVASLVTLGGRLLDAHAQGVWPREERAFCDEIECGYRNRCHEKVPVEADPPASEPISTP